MRLAPEEPVSLSFRPTHDRAQRLATPFAIEVATERDARVLEAMDAEYLGEINVSRGKLSSSSTARIAAKWGATHFRVTTSESTKRVDILLYRIEKQRWEHLPVLLQPPALTAL